MSSPSPSPVSVASQDAHESAALWRNLLAMVYDMFLVAPLLMANALVLVTIFGPRENVYVATVPPALMQFTSYLVVIAFFTLFWRKSGQTLGMQAWKIRLVSREGGPVPTWRCLLRGLMATVSLIPFGLGYWWSLVDPQGMRWHDRLSGTRLVKVVTPDRDSG